MAKQDTLPRLPIKGAVNGPISGWSQEDYAGYGVILNDDGVVDNIFTSSLATPDIYEVADEAARLALAGTAKKGDTAKQADNNLSYQLKTGTGSVDSDWVCTGVDSVTRDEVGQLILAATGVDQNVVLSPSGAGYVQVDNHLFVDGEIEGDGSLITDLNASEINTGTVPDGVLSANVALRDEVNTFTDTTESTTYSNGSAVFAGGVGVAKNLNVNGIIAGSGSGITALSASNISSGTLAVARGGTNISSYTTGNYIRASGAASLEQRTPTQVRADVGADNASNITTGTIGAARLPAASTATQGATLYATSVEAAAALISDKAVVPTGVKAYVDGVSSTTASAGKLVKTNGSGLIDGSFIALSGAVAWDDLPGTSTDTGGTQGDVLSELVYYFTDDNRGIVVSAEANGISWFDSLGATNKLTAATPSGASKTWTLPNKTGTVLLSTDAAIAATADAIVQATSAGTIAANFIPTLVNITYTGQLRTPSLTSGAVGGSSTSKLAIYDATGTLRGYIPVYPS